MLFALTACGHLPRNPDSNRAEGPAPGDIVLLVNGEPIRQGEIDKTVESIVALAPPTYDKGRLARMRPRIIQEAREQLILDRLIGQAIRREEIQVNDAQVDARLKVVEKYLQVHGSTLEQDARDQGRTPAEIRDATRARLAQDALWDKLLAIKPPTPDEVKSFYESHRDRYSWPPAVHAREILVALPADHKPTRHEHKTARERVEMLRRRIEKGDDFAAVAREASDGLSARKGGDLGWIIRGAPLPKPVTDTLFSLEIGETSEPVESRQGYHLLQITERRPPQSVDFEEIQPVVAEDLMRQRREALTPGLLRQMRASAAVTEP